MVHGQNESDPDLAVADLRRRRKKNLPTRLRAWQVKMAFQLRPSLVQQLRAGC